MCAAMLACPWCPLPNQSQQEVLGWPHPTAKVKRININQALIKVLTLTTYYSQHRPFFYSSFSVYFSILSSLQIVVLNFPFYLGCHSVFGPLLSFLHPLCQNLLLFLKFS